MKAITGAHARLRRAKRRVSRRKKYSKRWRKAVQFVGNIHREISNQRRDFQHKLSREIVDANQFIAVEDLNSKGLAGGMLVKSVADVGWSSFLNMLAYKAESAGRQLVKVDPRGTSQRCPCGKPAPKKLSNRKHTLHLWTANHKRPRQQFRNTQARTEPSTVNGGAVMLPWVEKPTPLGGGEVTSTGVRHEMTCIIRPEGTGKQTMV